MAMSDRVCPVCQRPDENHSIGAVLNQVIGSRSTGVYVAGCGCRQCGAMWTESYNAGTGETVNSDIQPNGLTMKIDKEGLPHDNA